MPDLVWLFVLLPCAVCVHQEQTIQQLEQRIALFQSDSALSGAESGVSNRVAALHDRFQNQDGTNRRVVFFLALSMRWYAFVRIYVSVNCYVRMYCVSNYLIFAG